MEGKLCPAPKRRDKTYRKYLEDLVMEYNANGRQTVLMTCDTFFPIVDGVINVLDNYAHLVSQEMNVLVLVPAFKGTIPQREYPVLGVKSAYSGRLCYQVALPALDRRAGKILKKLHIDLIHCHSPFFVGRYVLRLHKKRGIPLISTFHSQYRQDFVKYVGDNFLANFLTRFILKTFNSCDEVWTMNPASREVLRSYGYRGPVRIVPHGTEIPLSGNYEEERAHARAILGVKDEWCLVCVGRLVTQKNILFLADVLGELKSRGLKFRVIFVGDGPDKGKLVKRLAEKNVSNETVFTGHVSDIGLLTSFYAAADLHLFPSKYDTFGLVKLEAASRYTPTVFVENSVASSDVKNGVNGYIFPENVSEFADGVIKALSDREKLREIGENAFRELYVTWHDVIKTAIGYYREIISAHAQDT